MKKGFTLIELLAVIVILAIITLIATPVVLNIIKESRETANLISAEMYLDAVEMSIATSTSKNKKILNGTYNILENGNICLEYTEDECTEELTVEVYGTIPSIGSTITTKDGQITSTAMKLDNKTIVMNNKGKLVHLPSPKSFSEDDWETITLNVKVGNLSKYNVGDTKEVKLEEFTNKEANSNGLYTVRIANTPAEADEEEKKCGTDGFSETACGFVIEFVDVITTHQMNLTDTNAGGWRDSEMRRYVNKDIYNSFEKKLKENIIETYVVSGHEEGITENYKTIDKIYLLSTKEVWGKVGTTNVIVNDTAEVETRQLDYYKSTGVTTNNCSEAIKKSNGIHKVYWWLRSVNSNITGSFYRVHDDGSGVNHYASSPYGVVVAFRLG